VELVGTVYDQQYDIKFVRIWKINIFSFLLASDRNLFRVRRFFVWRVFPARFSSIMKSHEIEKVQNAKLKEISNLWKRMKRGDVFLQRNFSFIPTST
jgi:hypothetical protein